MWCGDEVIEKTWQEPEVKDSAIQIFDVKVRLKFKRSKFISFQGLYHSAKHELEIYEYKLNQIIRQFPDRKLHFLV